MATINAINSSDPIQVALGGTGNATVTAYSVVCGGTTNTGALQVVSGLGSSGQVLTSNGAGALPSWQSASGAVTTINGDSGSATGATLTLTAGTTGFTFTGAGSTLTMSVSKLNLPAATSAGVGSVTIGGVNNFVSLGQNVLVGPTGTILTTLSGSGNVGIGFNAAADITSGNNNIGVGTGAVGGVTTGSSNIGIGIDAAVSVTTGSANIAIGNLALESIATSSSNNVAVGSAAGGNIAGIASQNTLIGYHSGSAYTTTESYNIIVGSTAGTIGESNIMRLGNDSGTGHATTAAYIYGSPNFPSISTAGVVQSNSSGAFSSTNGTNGQVLVGGGSAPAWANITSGNSSVTITNGANTIDLAVASPATAWSEVTGTSASMAVNKGYIANNAGLVTLTLPTTAALGSIIEVAGKGAGGWLVAQNSGQLIHFGSSTTTTGAGGSLASTLQYDTVKLLCITANTTFTVLSAVGNLTVV